MTGEPLPVKPDGYDVLPYATGLCCCSVCAPSSMSAQDVEDAVNRYHPTGISSLWKISEDEAFAGGEPMPNACTQSPDRQHWLLNC